MTTPDGQDDFEVELSTLIAAIDRPPSQVVAAAEAAWTWRTIDEELALITFDSSDPELSAAARGAGGRRLTFEQDGQVVDIEIADGRLIVIFDLDEHRVRCETATGTAWNTVIARGECDGQLPEARPIRIVIDDPSGRTVIRTPWFLP